MPDRRFAALSAARFYSQIIAGVFDSLISKKKKKPITITFYKCYGARVDGRTEYLLKYGPWVSTVLHSKRSTNNIITEKILAQVFIERFIDRVSPVRSPRVRRPIIGRNTQRPIITERRTVGGRTRVGNGVVNGKNKIK